MKTEPNQITPTATHSDGKPLFVLSFGGYHFALPADVAINFLTYAKQIERTYVSERNTFVYHLLPQSGLVEAEVRGPIEIYPPKEQA